MISAIVLAALCLIINKIVTSNSIVRNRYHHKNHNRNNELEAAIPDVIKLHNASYPIENRTLLWKELAHYYLDPHRESDLRVVCDKQQGVYVHSHPATVKANISNTIVVAYMIVNGLSDELKILFSNWLCYLKKLDYKALLIYDTADDDSYDQIVNMTRGFETMIELFPYPRSLFWSQMARKTNELLGRINHRKRPYLGYTITTSQFGYITKLTPILELMTLGYDVIYTDLDIAFLRDPVPYIFSSSAPADLIFSVERRSCDYYSGSFNQGIRTEPNGGYLIWRSTQQSIAVALAAIEHMLGDQAFNDQWSLNAVLPSMGFYSNSCRGVDEHVPVDPAPRVISTKASVCFLPEELFQNGKMSFFCVKDNANRIGTMLQTNTTKGDVSRLDYIYRLGMFTAELTDVTDAGGTQYDGRFVPYFIHANYNYAAKVAIFREYGVLIADETHQGAMCKAIDYPRLMRILVKDGDSWDTLYGLASAQKTESLERGRGH